MWFMLYLVDNYLWWLEGGKNSKQDFVKISNKGKVSQKLFYYVRIHKFKGLEKPFIHYKYKLGTSIWYIFVFLNKILTYKLDYLI